MATNDWDEISRRAKEAQLQRSRAYERRVAAQRQAAAPRAPRAAIDERLSRKNPTVTAAAAPAGDRPVRRATSNTLARSLYDERMAQKKKKGARTSIPAPAGAAPPQLADPGTNPTTRQPLDRATRVGSGGQGVTGFQSAAAQLSALRAQQDAGAPLPGREVADRGYQYQPDLWAQQTALRNARVGYNATANMYRDGRLKGQADAQLEAEFRGNPALQGLERSKMFQDNITADQTAATTQRGQDASFNLGLREMRSNERMNAARNLSAEGIAANRDAAALEGIDLRGRYDLRGEQIRAQSDYAAARLRAAVEQQGNTQKQAQQDFDNVRTMVSDATMGVDEDGNPQENPRRQQELTNFLINSQRVKTEDARAAIGAYTQFANAVQAAGEVADSSHPVMARLFGWFKANKGKPMNEKQLQAEMSRLVTDDDFRSAFSGSDQYKAFLQSLPYSNLQE